MQRATVRSLAQCGLVPIVAQTVREALRIIEAGGADAYWLDVGLPDGRGTDLLPRIRASQPEASIVVCTGWTDARAREDAAAAGVTFVEKPIEHDTLRAFAAGVMDAQRRPSRASGTRHRVFVRPAWTPRSISRDLIRGATNARLLRVPTVKDTVVVVGHVGRTEWLAEDVRQLHANGDGAEAVLSSAPSVAAVVVAGADAALRESGTVALLRAERPHVPVLVVAPEIREAQRRPLDALRLAHATGGPEELADQIVAFVDAMLVAEDDRRRALDARAIACRLTDRETELVWLCSMILPRARVAELFGPGLRDAIEGALAKLGAKRFEEIGRLARP